MTEVEEDRPLSNCTIAFRGLEEADLPLLLKWLQRPHVLEWWDEGEDAIEKVREAYGPEKGIGRYIATLSVPGRFEQMPFGFFQHYRVDDDTVSIDQFMGVPELVGKGLGTVSVRRFTEMIFTEIAPRRIILDPAPDNFRAIRCYEKAGFRHFKTEAGVNGDPAYYMELTKDA